MLMLRPARMWLSIIALALGVAGCGEFPSPTLRPIVDPVPSLRTPEETLRYLEWSWNHRDLGRYAEIVAGDFQFIFHSLDPYGNLYRDDPWTREDEIASIGHLFHGDGQHIPAATSISLALDRNFNVTHDPRFPDAPRVRRM